MKFKDKVVLVTGSSRGIGRATAICSEDASFITGSTLVVDGGYQ